MVSRLPDTLSADQLPNNSLKKRVKRPKKKPEVGAEKNCVELVVEFDTTKVLAEIAVPTTGQQRSQDKAQPL